MSFFVTCINIKVDCISFKDVLEILANHYNQSLDPNISPFSTAVVGIHRLKNGSLEGNCDFRKIGGYPAGY